MIAKQMNGKYKMMKSGIWRSPIIAKIFRGLVILVLLLGTGSPAAAGSSLPIFLPYAIKNWVYAVGNITGTVSDAIDLHPVAGVKVCYKENCTLTNSSGIYTLTGLPPQHVILDASKPGDFYIPQTADITVVGKQTVMLNIVISKELIKNNVRLRFIVTWRTEPSWPPDGVPNDLDSELWGLGDPLYNASFHIYPSTNIEDRGDCTGPFPDACIEVDAMMGAGPETVDLRDTLANITYYFGVLNTNVGYPGVPPITQSLAKVQVFDTTGLVRTYDVPTVGSGELWYVFKFDTAETITTTNCLTTMPDVAPDGTLLPPECP
jgi:hypothetical protein